MYKNRQVSPSTSISFADFRVPDPFQVTITAGPIPSSPVCVLIMATEDTQIEGDHGFTVSINQLSLSTVTVGSPGSALVTITDNDGTHILDKIDMYAYSFLLQRDRLHLPHLGAQCWKEMLPL